MSKIIEYKGWKAGDMAYGNQFSTEKTVYGEIKEFHPDDKLGAAVTIVSVADGSYMTILVKTLSEKEPKKVRKLKQKKRKT